MEEKDKLAHEGCCGGHHHHHEGGGCGCGHHHEEEEAITLNLVLDDGQEIRCEVIGIFEAEEKEYIALMAEGDDRVMLYSYDEEEDEPVLENIEDEKEFEKVSEVFWEIFGEDAQEEGQEQE